MPAFLVHGVPDTSAIWDDVVAHRDGDDIIRPDLPGFGGPLPAGFEPTTGGDAASLEADVEAVEVAAELETLCS